MNLRYIYRVRGTKDLSKVSVLFLSLLFDSNKEKAARKLAKESGLKVFAYAPINQPFFEKLFRKINPKLVVPLDSESYSFFEGLKLFEHEGLDYFKLSKGYSSVVSPQADQQLLCLIGKYGSMSKRSFNRRALLISELSRKRGHTKRNVNHR
mgnify:CR=1 FL=1